MIRVPVDLTAQMPFSRVTAAKLAQTASHFDCQLTLEGEGRIINLKSMLGLLSLPMTLPEKLSLVCDGADELAAAEAILAIVGKAEE